MNRPARLCLFLAIAIGLFAAADAAAWWFVTARMQDEVAAWQRDRLAEGAVVLTGPAARGGWPFEAELTLPGVTLATDTPGQPNAFVWQSDRVRLVYAPWRPTGVDVLAEGTQTVRFGPAAAVALTATRLDVRVPLTLSGQAQGITVTARGVSVPLQAGPLGIDAITVRLREADAFVSATQATLPMRTLPFGGTITSLDVHARFTGAVPPMFDLTAATAALRDGRQRLLLDDIALRWGPLDIRGHASLGLDKGLQPEGSASVQLTGFAEVIEALARSGAITRNDARVVATLLGLMARPGAGDIAEADLPLTLKDHTLSVGAIPVLRLPVLSVP